jgi:hypothetical protein
VQLLALGSVGTEVHFWCLQARLELVNNFYSLYAHTNKGLKCCSMNSLKSIC